MRHLPLVAAGTGPLRPWLEEQGIHVTGWLHREALRSVFEGCAAMLLTPRWQEPFGIAGKEALSLGIPVAAWKSGGIEEWHPGPLPEWGDVDSVAGVLRAAVGRPPSPPRHAPGREETYAALSGLYRRAVGLP